MVKIDLSKEKETVIDLIKNEYPVHVAMIEKNWKRYATVVEYLITCVPNLENKSILDYGCGSPVVVKILSMLGYNVTGYEPYAGVIEKNIARIYGLVDSYFTSLENTKKFDVVLMVDVIEHLSVIKPIMRDVNSRTAQNGYLLVSTPNVLRIEMWLAFMFRKTGHPQSIHTFINSDDNYTNHQREFTMNELKLTLRHFGFKVVNANIKDTQPEKNLLINYHRLLGKEDQQLKITLKSKIKDHLLNILKKMFPLKFTNNLLVVAQKVNNL